MAETVRLKAAGLSRYSDALSKRAEGSLNVADNIVIDQDNIYSPRRGFSKLNGSLTEQAKNIVPYSGKLLLYAKKPDPDTYKVVYLFDHTDTGSEITEISGFTSTDAYVRTAESNGNIYFTGSSGIYKLDGLASSIKEAGVPEALPPKLALSAAAGTILAANQSARYRIVFGYRDANNNLLLGAPSNAVLITNGASPKDVDVTIYFPQEITTSHFYQIYRTAAYDTGVDPGDLCQLVYEAFYTSGTSVTVTDKQPDELRGIELYTNDTREGIQNAAYQPPKASDITLFNNHIFFSNVTFRQRLDIQLLTGSGFDNAAPGQSTVTIGSRVYTAATAENLANREFLANPGTTFPAIDIGLVAESLCRCINADTSSTVYAYYDSGPNDLPGMIRLEERNFGGSSFVVSSNISGKFSPDLNSAPESARTSTAESKPNLLMFSKYQEPEAVPIKNQFEIGSRAYPIVRIVALRDSLFVFKGDGIWRITGTSEANFSVDAFDSSTKIISAGSMCVLNNLVFGLFDQGICQVSESGVSILSREIEGDIRALIGSHYSNLANLSFGFAYETDRKYVLWVPILSIDTYPTKAYVYNTITQAWTMYDRTAWAGVVNPADDRMYIASGGVTYISKERKDATYTDFSDEQTEVEAVSINGKVITLASTTGLEVGDMYVESSSKFGRITEISNNDITVDEDLAWLPHTVSINTTNVDSAVVTVDSVTNINVGDTYDDGANTALIISIDSELLTLTLADDPGWITGPVTVTTQWAPEVRGFYNSTIEWNPVHLNSPGHMKQWYEALVLCTKDFKSADMSFKTELDSGWESVTLTGNAIGDWGLFPWGELPWGGGGDTTIAHRTYIPRYKQRSSTIHAELVVDTMYTDWEVSGFELTYRDAGQRLLRR